MTHKRGLPLKSWLGAAPKPANDYLKALQASTEEHKEAAELLRAAITGRRTYDAMIVYVKQDLPDVELYGGGLDRASELLQAGGGIDDLNIAHDPYPNR